MQSISNLRKVMIVSELVPHPHCKATVFYLSEFLYRVKLAYGSNINLSMEAGDACRRAGNFSLINSPTRKQVAHLEEETSMKRTQRILIFLLLLCGLGGRPALAQ